MMQILNLEKGMFFQMGKGQNWRVVHPDMGAKELTLNHGLHAPGNEFNQHTHDGCEDAIVVLEGGGAIRQGRIYTPIAAGEVIFVPADEIHGTVNTTDQPARVMSFQAPPDMALYRGERNLPPEATPKPKPGHRSAVQVVSMAKGGPVFGKPGDWRSVVSPDRGSKYLALDYIKLGSGEGFGHQAGKKEEILVLIGGKAQVKTDNSDWDLEKKDVIFLKSGDKFFLSQVGQEPLIIVHCWAL